MDLNPEPHCPTTTISHYPNCPIAPLPQYPTTPLPQLPHCSTTTMSHYPTTQLPYCTTLLQLHLYDGICETDIDRDKRREGLMVGRATEGYRPHGRDGHKERIILKCVVIEWYTVDWFHLHSVTSCERNTDTSGSINCRKFLTGLELIMFLERDVLSNYLCH